MFRTSRAVPAVLSFVALAACGGSGDGTANVSQVDLGEPPVFADGTIITASDFEGETFPFYFVEGFSEGGGTTLRRGVGSATVSLDGDTVLLAIGDGDFIDLDRVVGDTFEAQPATDLFFLVEDLGVARVARLDDDELLGVADIAGIFGFQTPSAFMPDDTIARYNIESYARIILTENGDDVIAVIDDIGDVDLLADFSRGDIGGTLFDGSGFVDVDGDDFRDDALLLFLELENGRISGGTFSGTLSGDAVAFIDDTDFVDLNPTFAGTRVDGIFFGNGASRIGGTFEGDYRSAGPDGSFVGYFDVGLD